MVTGLNAQNESQKTNRYDDQIAQKYTLLPLYDLNAAIATPNGRRNRGDLLGLLRVGVVLKGKAVLILGRAVISAAASTRGATFVTHV
jgi:hypothetical protein